jgi:hypothetical protein
LNYLYEIPVGHNRQVNISNRFLDAVVGGWSISGITIYRTGSPFSVSFNVPSNIVGWQGGRADAVSGASIYAGQSGSHDVVNGVQWFNTAAFQAPQPWAWGNSSRNSVYGPGFWNWDLGLQKLFRITEHHSLELRGDFLNAFNHFNLANLTTGTATTTIADTRDGGLPTPTAGKILTGTGNPRVIQLGLKYMF